jgi:hypothetical protein
MLISQAGKNPYKHQGHTQREGGLQPSSHPPSIKIKKNRCYKNNDIKHFTRFALQPKSATGIS